VAWAGVEPIGERDGRIALFLADKLPLLAQQRPLGSEPLTEREEKLLAVLESTGASFFDSLHQAAGGAIPARRSKRSGAWCGAGSSPTTRCTRCARISLGLRARERRAAIRRALCFARAHDAADGAGALGIIAAPPVGQSAKTCGEQRRERSHALALQLLNRYGVLLRESVAAENVPGGFSAVYDVLKALEESGRIRRGYFVGGLGATQFALPAAVDLLRQLRTEPPAEKPEFVQLAATDPGQSVWICSALARSSGDG
jgi:ATP-dependent helicase Lhr and Lhr-like helicase